MYHGMIQQLSDENTGNNSKCPFPFVSEVDWADYDTGRVKMIPSLDKHKYWVIPLPLTNARLQWWMWLFWSDPSQLIPVSLLRTGTWIVPWDADVKLPMIYAVLSAKSFKMVDNHNYKTTFLFCRFGKLFVVLGCETFEFLMTLEALNFVLVYWLAPN